MDLLRSGTTDNLLLVLAQLLSPGGHSKSLISRTTNDEMFKTVRKGIARPLHPCRSSEACSRSDPCKSCATLPCVLLAHGVYMFLTACPKGKLMPF